MISFMTASTIELFTYRFDNVKEYVLQTETTRAHHKIKYCYSPLQSSHQSKTSTDINVSIKHQPKSNTILTKKYNHP